MTAQLIRISVCGSLLCSTRLLVESLVQPVRHKLEDQDEDDEHRDVNKRAQERFTGVSALDEVVRVRER